MSKENFPQKTMNLTKEVKLYETSLHLENKYINSFQRFKRREVILASKNKTKSNGNYCKINLY